MDGDANLGRPWLDFMEEKAPLESFKALASSGRGSPFFTVVHRGFTVVHLAEKLINSVAHKDAISALSGMMKMEAILSHVVLLATSNRHRHKTQTLKFGTCCTERADNFIIC